jgi:predicted enzyme related to lactoylglutathione lyase
MEILKMTLQFRGLDFVAYEVSDFHKSVAFYKDTLGLPLRFVEDGSYQVAEFSIPPTTLSLYCPVKSEARPPRPAGTLFLAVDDIEEAARALKEKGVKVTVEPFETRVCYMGAFEDPDGNEIGLHVSKDGTWG